MDALQLILAFMQNAISSAFAKAKAYTDNRVDAFPRGLVWKGEVDYFQNLPADPKEGDCYTVKFAGAGGSDSDGTEYAWGNSNGTKKWIPLGPDISGKMNKVKNSTAGNLAILDEEGNVTDSGKKPEDISSAGTDFYVKAGVLYITTKEVK